MACDGFLADRELGGNHAVRLSRRDEAKDFDFTSGQWSPRDRRRRGHKGRHVCGVGCRSKPVESFRGRLELHLRAFVVAERTVRKSHERANARDFVRCLDLPPDRACLAEQRDGGIGVSLCECNRAGSFSARCAKKRSVDRSGDAREFLRGGMRRGGILRRDQDSDGGAECVSARTAGLRLS
jgi:hypothetical protein